MEQLKKQHCSPPPTVTDVGKFVAVDENGSFALVEGSGGGNLYWHTFSATGGNNLLSSFTCVILDTNSSAPTIQTLQDIVNNGGEIVLTAATTSKSGYTATILKKYNSDSTRVAVWYVGQNTLDQEIIYWNTFTTQSSLCATHQIF